LADRLFGTEELVDWIVSGDSSVGYVGLASLVSTAFPGKPVQVIAWHPYQQAEDWPVDPTIALFLTSGNRDVQFWRANILPGTSGPNPTLSWGESLGLQLNVYGRTRPEWSSLVDFVKNQVPVVAYRLWNAYRVPIGNKEAESNIERHPRLDAFWGWVRYPLLIPRAATVT